MTTAQPDWVSAGPHFLSSGPANAYMRLLFWVASKGDVPWSNMAQMVKLYVSRGWVGVCQNCPGESTGMLKLWQGWHIETWQAVAATAFTERRRRMSLFGCRSWGLSQRWSPHCALSGGAAWR